jgi:uncharacterized membrane protein YkvA (DUF1232 family)
MLNLTLSEKEQQLVRKAYIKSRDNTLAHDIAYVAKLKPSVFDKLLTSHEPALQRLGRYAIQLQRFITECLNDSYAAPPHSLHAFTAVLLYLVNPYDAIPDNCSDRGYADDIYVLELGLADGGEVLRAYALARGIILPA